MIQIVLRNSKAGTGTLAVRIVNRTIGMNTYVSMHLKMKVKDWSDSSQLPKNIYDEHPVKELNGTTYATLAVIIQDVKKLLMALDDSNTISLAAAKQVIKDTVYKKTLADKILPEKQEIVKTKPTFVEFAEQYVSECKSGERLKMKSSRKIAPGTIRGLSSFIERLKQYEREKKCVIDWDDLTLEFYRKFKQFYLDKGYAPNTIGGFIKKMKTVLFAAKELHLTTRDDFTSRMWFVDIEDVENVYITESRLREMYNLDVTNIKDLVTRAENNSKDGTEKDKVKEDLSNEIYCKHLSEARDIFLMGCLTGQRVSDYKRINEDMIETIQGERKFLHLVQVKTGKDVYVPYNNMMVEIMKRYDGHLPSMCDQHLNRYIKVLGMLLGWTEPAGLTERKGIMQIPSSKRFCDAIVTHTARRSFATNAYKNGVPLSAIMAITGHSSETLLRKYLKLSSKEKALVAAAEFDKVNKAL